MGHDSVISSLCAYRVRFLSDNPRFQHGPLRPVESPSGHANPRSTSAFPLSDTEFVTF